jgi:hypothetical protein
MQELHIKAGEPLARDADSENHHLISKSDAEPFDYLRPSVRPTSLHEAH